MNLFFMGGFCESIYFNILALIFAIIGYFIFRNKIDKGVSKTGLLGFIIIYGFNWLPFFFKTYNCGFSQIYILNVICFLSMYIVLVVGYGLNDMRNHSKSLKQ